MKLLLYSIVFAIFSPCFSIARQLPPSSTTAKSLKISLKDNINTNETIVEFKKGYSALYKTSDGDAPSSGGTTIFLTSLTSDNKNMAINFMPELSEVQEVKLNVDTKVSKKAVLAFDEVPIAENYHLVLKDKYLNTETLVSLGTKYEFTMDKSIKNSFGADRLTVAIVHDIPSKNVTGSTFRVFPNPAINDLYVEAGSLNVFMEASIYNLSGILVKKSKVSDAGIDVSDLLDRTYIVVLTDMKSDKPLAVRKFLKE